MYSFRNNVLNQNPVFTQVDNRVRFVLRSIDDRRYIRDRTPVSCMQNRTSWLNVITSINNIHINKLTFYTRSVYVGLNISELHVLK